jgi:hypothetical protein
MRISRIWLGEPAEGYTLAQAGFRWGNDDGSESAYTFINAQNVDLSQASNIAAILRLLINTTGDTPAGQFKIQVKRSSGPETEWRDVPVA